MFKYIMRKERKEHKDDKEHKNEHKEPRIIYMTKTGKVFHIREKCHRIKDRKADVIMRCGECLKHTV